MLEAVRRGTAHADAEVSRNTAITMETLSDPASFAWAGSLAWAATRRDDKGWFLEVATDLDSVADHYDWMFSQAARESFSLYGQLATDWWNVWDASWKGVNPDSGEEINGDVFSLLLTDGDRGLSGEIAWLNTAPPASCTPARRQALFESYFASVRGGEVEAIMAHFSAPEYFSSAVRPYFGYDEPYLKLETLAQLREFYERFYAAVTVTDVAVSNWYSREWFIFAEARWQLMFADGTGASMVTVEVMPLGSDGKFIGRAGYGTSLVSVTHS